MADPVSWFLIERGWKVVDRDGNDAGRVEEVVGDSNADIFNGLSISTGLLGAPRYVPSERVAAITEGQVQLDLDAEAVHDLGEYEEPPPSEDILAPDPKR
jgi:3-isopropylmalate dehydratase small subunit